MAIRVALATCLVLCIAVAQPADAMVVPYDNAQPATTIGLWHFDEASGTALDHTAPLYGGSGGNASDDNLPMTGTVAREPSGLAGMGNVARFDLNTGNRLDTSAIQPEPASFTIEAIARVEGDSYRSTDCTWGIAGRQGGSAQTMQFRYTTGSLQNGDGALDLHLILFSPSGTKSYVANTNYSYNQDYYVAASYDDATRAVRLYGNPIPEPNVLPFGAKLLYSTTMPDNRYTSTNNLLTVGRSDGSNPLNGTLDEVRYSSAALPVDALKTALPWDSIEKGLEREGGAPGIVPTFDGDSVRIAGTATSQYWTGRTLRSTPTYDVPEGGELAFEVDRVSLAGSGTAWRSSMWMWQDNANFVHFADDRGEQGWQFNANNNHPVGNYNPIARFDPMEDDGNHTMVLTHDGTYVKMFLDGIYGASQEATFDSNIHFMVTGQTRATGDTVDTTFANAHTATRQFAYMYDNFNSNTIDPNKWEIVEKGLERQGPGTAGAIAARVENGELIIEGDNNKTIWGGISLRTVETFSPETKISFAVDRDTMLGSGTAYRSSIWLWADDNHFLHFSQNIGENGWQYNYADGVRTGLSAGGGLNIPAFDSIDADPAFHEMMLVFRPENGTDYIDMYVDGTLGATQAFTNWGDLSYQFMMTGQTRWPYGTPADSVMVCFDNVRISPEPTTLAILGFGVLALRRRRTTTR